MTALFLLCSWFSPRLTFLICFLLGCIPPNPTELVVDIIAVIVCPRLLISYWLYVADQPLLAVIFGVAGVFELLGAAAKVVNES